MIISDNIRPSVKVGGQLVALAKDSRCMHLEVLREVNPAVKVSLGYVGGVVDEGDEYGGVAIQRQTINMLGSRTLQCGQ